MVSNKDLNIFVIALFLTAIEFGSHGMDIFECFGHFIAVYFFIKLIVWIWNKCSKKDTTNNDTVMELSSDG